MHSTYYIPVWGVGGGWLGTGRHSAKESQTYVLLSLRPLRQVQCLLTNNIFHTNPSNFPKIQAAINTHFVMLWGSNLVTFLFLTCVFHFWHLFCTTTVFDDWQGHVTVSCKEHIAKKKFRNKEKMPWQHQVSDTTTCHTKLFPDKF